MKSRPSLAGLCACSLLCLDACSEVRSVHPLSNRNKAKVDEDAIGRWQGKLTESNDIVIEIDRHPLAGKGNPKIPKGTMILRRKDRQPNKKPSECQFFVTAIGEERLDRLLGKGGF